MFKLNFNCPKDISQMPSTGQGRFCDSCNKDIVDFRGMSAEEVQKKLAEQKGKTCGIFVGTQLINPFRSKITSNFRMAFCFVFFMGMTSTQLLAQDTTQLDTTIATPIDYSQCANCFFEIHGTVTDDKGDPIPFARIWVDLDSSHNTLNPVYTQTDLDGKYKIQLPTNAKESVNLSGTSVFYDTTTVSNIPVANDGDIVQVDFVLTQIPRDQLPMVGLLIPADNFSRDPYEIGKTRLDGEDLRMWD